MKTHTASISIIAPVQKVFEALTKPELVALWQFGRLLDTSWKPGNAIKFSVEFEGRMLEQWGTVLEFRNNEFIKYNLFTPRADLEDKIENYNETSYSLSQQNGITTVEIIQEDNRPNGFVGISLKPILVALKKTVENQP